MDCHEFGVMERAPRPGERYDCYEPEKYGCVRVGGALAKPLLAAELDCFWHSLDVPGKGLACCGITLIPPESLGAALAAAEGYPGLRPVAELLRRARAEGRFVIHFGL